jgi:hypothetical protein
VIANTLLPSLVICQPLNRRRSVFGVLMATQLFSLRIAAAESLDHAVDLPKSCQGLKKQIPASIKTIRIAD